MKCHARLFSIVVVRLLNQTYERRREYAIRQNAKHVDLS